MISSVIMKNFGPLKNIEWNDLGKINIVIGQNEVGKTFLLKAIYTAVKCIEKNGRGNENKNIQELLSDRLYWTLQSYKIGDIVRKPGNEQLEFSISDTNNRLSFCFGHNATNKVIVKEGKNWSEPQTNSIFIPEKEVFSLQKIIFESYEQQALFGFDATYHDLAKALLMPLKIRQNINEFSEASKKIQKIIDGKIVYDTKTGQWVYKKGNLKFTMGVTAEGIKKISTLDILLQSNYLSKESRIFIDEPECSLHPHAISDFMDIVTDLAKEGIQFFIATHSYFVLKKMLINAEKENISIPILLLSNDNAKIKYDNLLEGMPKNSIINESVRLYKEEIGVAV